MGARRTSATIVGDTRERKVVKRTSVWNPVEQRLFGLVSIAEGLLTLVLGKYAPSLVYRVALWGAQRAHRRSLNA